jgi:colanic acid/amylovoran biosynthesis glycosyltransferase
LSDDSTRQRRPDDSRPTVAHLVTPYLFATGSWIHAQLVHASTFRPIVITQSTKHLDQFPFDPVYDLSSGSRGWKRPGFLFRKYVAGSFPAGPYRDIIRRESVRVIHAHNGWEGARTIGLGGNAGAAARPGGSRPKLPFVVSFYGRDASLLPRSRYWRRLYKRLFARADRIIAEGPHMADVLKDIGAPAERVRVVRLGIPIEAFPFRERRAEPSSAITGLIAGSLREKKGILQAMEALARIAPAHPLVNLRIIGDGELRPQIEARAAERDLRDRVKLLGYQPYSAYREELYKAQFLLAPSLTAADGDTEGGAPVCLLEAQATGLPVVATTHCDIPDATAPGKSALLAPEGDIAALASRLEELVRNPAAWAGMGRAGREHVEMHFDIRRQTERMAEVYREILRP